MTPVLKAANTQGPMGKVLDNRSNQKTMSIKLVSALWTA